MSVGPKPLKVGADFNMSAETICKAALDWIIKEFHAKIEGSTENDPFIIGIGSGSTIIPFVNLLTEFIKAKAVKPTIICIPTSEQARRLILDNLKYKYFKLGSLDEFNEIDVTIDGADAVFLNEKFIIKGGGAAHCQEKIIAEASKNYIVVVADCKKLEKHFEAVLIPVEVLPLALNSISRLFKNEFGDELISLSIRNCPSGSGKIGPIVTDNGNLILDLKFRKNLLNDPKHLDLRLRQYAGVIEAGIFWRLPKTTLIVYPSSDQSQVVSNFLF